MISNLLLSGLLLCQIGPGEPIGGSPTGPSAQRRAPAADFSRTVELTAGMVNDAAAQRLAGQHGLNIMNVTWEDTGRYKNSSVGPNISDLTIQVQVPSQRNRLNVVPMPVIRFPNFSDKTADVDPRAFTLLVGNERNRRLQRISLHDYLSDVTRFMSRPNRWRTVERSLLADRDSYVLASAQACFLPVPQAGKATFNPVVFNYQSVQGDPAVLTILATREGTSMEVIENASVRSNQWGQPLFFNRNGQRASLTGERLSDFRNQSGQSGARAGTGLNMVLLVQVPLIQRNPRRSPGLGSDGMAPMASAPEMARGGGSNVEEAVIGSGQIEGPFEETRGLEIRRDPRFPIRVTVQFYQATSNGVVSREDMSRIQSNIEQVYRYGDFVGSLVTGGDTGRPTEYWGLKVQPSGWWNDFWRRYERDTGENRAMAISRLTQFLGTSYRSRAVNELYVRDLLRQPSR